MEHLLVKAAATATTDAGEFTAIAAAYTVDRVKDRIVPGAFAKTISRWQQSGKRIPLHWNHEGDAKSIIGSVDPAALRETDEGLYVEGKLDLADNETAREAWRSMKNGAMSLSFGYLVENSRKATAGVTDLLEIDLFEISIVPVPANADTRVLSLKSGDAALIVTELQAIKERLDRIEMAEKETKDADVTDKEPKARSVDPLSKRARELAVDVRSGGLTAPPPQKKDAPEPKPTPEFDPAALRKRTRDLMVQTLSGIEVP